MYDDKSLNVSFKFGTYSDFLTVKQPPLWETNTFYNVEDIQALYLDNSAFYTTLFDTSEDDVYVLNLNKEQNINPYAYTIFPKINELQIGNLSLNSTYLIKSPNDFYNFYSAPSFNDLIGLPDLNLPSSSKNNATEDDKYYPPTVFQYNYSPSSFYVFGTGNSSAPNYDPHYNGLLTINYHTYYPIVEISNDNYNSMIANTNPSETSFYHIYDTGELKLQNLTYMPMQKITQDDYDDLEENNNINPNILYIIVEDE